MTARQVQVYVTAGGVKQSGVATGPGIAAVIASEAKQSILRHNGWMDCFVRSAPRNDAELSFRGDAKYRTRNLEIPRCAIAHLRSDPSDIPE
jgi:hypothetical protein